jgi:tungstate transport system ATP-binding protein
MSMWCGCIVAWTRTGSWRRAGLEPVPDVPPQNLSGGEQKVALTRAMILGPQLLLLDEPTANLDGAAKKQTTELILRLCSGGERTVLIASHETTLLEMPGVKRLALVDGHLHWLT